MKNRLRLLVLLLVMVSVALSCSKDDCTQEAMSVKVTDGLSKSTHKVFVCHNGNTLEINETSLQAHLNHGDTEGECSTLSDGGLHFDDGNVVEIGCNYELPFIHVADDGSTWYFSSPN